MIALLRSLLRTAKRGLEIAEVAHVWHKYNFKMIMELELESKNQDLYYCSWLLSINTPNRGKAIDFCAREVLVIKRGHWGINVHILTDNEATLINVLQLFIFESRPVLLWMRIRLGWTFPPIWISGHKVKDVNEVADHLTRASSQRLSMILKPFMHKCSGLKDPLQKIKWTIHHITE